MPEKSKTISGLADGRLLLYFLLSAFLIIVLFDYVKPSPEEYVSYLSYCIYALGLIALFTFYTYHTRTEKEENCASVVHHQASKLLREVKVNQLEYHLHQFKDLGTKNKQLSVNRILTHIRTEAESKKFDSSLAILNSYKEEFAAENMRLLGFQKVALQLGIMGTFIGLAMAFKDLSGTKVDEQAIDHLLKSLRIPFSTSIAGLQVAFIIWLHVDHLQKKQEKLFRIMEECVDEVINLARHAIYKDSITVELQHVSSRMDELSGRIEKGNDLLYSQNSQIAEGISRLKNANTDLDIFINGIGEKQQEFMGSVKSLYDSLSPELISKELKYSLSNGAQEISGVMSKHLNDTLSRYSEVEDSMVAMNNNFKELQGYLAIQAKQGDENIMKHKQEIFHSFNEMVAMQKKYLEQLAKVDMRDQIKEIMTSCTTHLTTELKNNFEKLLPPISSLASEMAFHNDRIKRKAARRKNIIHFLTFSWGKINKPVIKEQQL